MANMERYNNRNEPEKHRRREETKIYMTRNYLFDFMVVNEWLNRVYVCGCVCVIFITQMNISTEWMNYIFRILDVEVSERVSTLSYLFYDYYYIRQWSFLLFMFMCDLGAGAVRRIKTEKYEMVGSNAYKRRIPSALSCLLSLFTFSFLCVWCKKDKVDENPRWNVKTKAAATKNVHYHFFFGFRQEVFHIHSFTLIIIYKAHSTLPKYIENEREKKL